MAILLDSIDDDLTDENGIGLADENDDLLPPLIAKTAGFFAAGAEAAETAIAGGEMGEIFLASGEAGEIVV